MTENLFFAFRAPDPLRYLAAKMNNKDRSSWFAWALSGDFTHRSGLFASLWSKLVRVESIHLDQKTPVNTGLVQVVQVVQAKSNIMHMRARAYLYLFFLQIPH